MLHTNMFMTNATNTLELIMCVWSNSRGEHFANSIPRSSLTNSFQASNSWEYSFSHQYMTSIPKCIDDLHLWHGRFNHGYGSPYRINFIPAASVEILPLGHRAISSICCANMAPIVNCTAAGTLVAAIIPVNWWFGMMLRKILENWIELIVQLKDQFLKSS